MFVKHLLIVVDSLKLADREFNLEIIIITIYLIVNITVIITADEIKIANMSQTYGMISSPPPLGCGGGNAAVAFSLFSVISAVFGLF